MLRILKTKEVVWPEGPTVGPSGEQGKTFEIMIQAITLFSEACAGKWVDADTAREIGQEVAIYVWERRRDEPDFLDGSLPIRPYLRVVVWSHLMLRCRKPKHADQAHKEFYDFRRACLESWMDPEAARCERELIAIYETVWRLLPPTCREVFRMVREEGMSCEEAAEATATSGNNIKKHLKRAGKDLRQARAAYERGLPLRKRRIRIQRAEVQ